MFYICGYFKKFTDMYCEKTTLVYKKCSFTSNLPFNSIFHELFEFLGTKFLPLNMPWRSLYTHAREPY